MFLICWRPVLLGLWVFSFFLQKLHLPPSPRSTQHARAQFETWFQKLSGIAVFLVPQWDLDAHLASRPSVGETTLSALRHLPLMVFAFNHSPGCSVLAAACRRHADLPKGAYACSTTTGSNPAYSKIQKILVATSAVLVVLLMSFVVSCVLTLRPEEVLAAKRDNLSVLLVFARRPGGGVFTALTRLITVVAMSGAFIGSYTGAHEATASLMVGLEAKKARFGATALLSVSVLLAAVMDLKVVAIIEKVASPMIALLLFIMPALAELRGPGQSPWRPPLGTLLTLAVGLLVLAGLVTH
eukprot:NODE_893_length_1390_cov_34.831469_g745_i0.p1 GENE.NODE_893_length_1390_cov_34.831469_g745_i0~~NODE_893_length_1390_cov_34.831469_g745_i0.p1  ORF type:complete len:298 (+),score=61.94 NODE_893_length_1390_cov_34.831469_g745_i0:356-1249(+)